MYKELSGKITSLKQRMDLKKVEIKGKLEKVERLKNHKYDPNCKFCVDNDFVRDATKAKKQLPDDGIEANAMMDTLDGLRKKMEEIKWVENTYENYTELLTERGTVKDKCAKASKDIIIATNELERLDTATKTVNQKIEIYHRNEVAVENNAEVQSKINAFKTSLGKLNIALHKQNQVLMDISGKKELFRSTIETVMKTLNEVTAMESELEYYQAYLQAVGRDGLPFQVISNITPELEKRSQFNSFSSRRFYHPVRDRWKKCCTIYCLF